MINKQFVATAMVFKPPHSEDCQDESVIVEVVEVKNGAVEIAFTLHRAKNYLTFNIDELEAAIKQFKKGAER